MCVKSKWGSYQCSPDIYRIEEAVVKKILFFTPMLLLLFMPFIAFSDVAILYRSGECSVDLRGNGNWEKALIDMQLMDRSVVRTGKNSSLEIDVNGDVVSIGSNKTVKIGDLFGKVQTKKKQKWLKGLKKYTMNIGGKGSGQSDTALAGVRGALADEDELEWFDEEDEEGTNLASAYQQGMDLFDNGEFTRAIDVFRNVMDAYGGDAMDGAVAFHMGVALFNVMRFNEAVGYLETGMKHSDSEFYDLALIHLALSQYLIQEYDESIEGLTAFLQKSSSEQLRPYALLMLGKNYKELGNKKEARRYFSEVTRRYQDTELAQEAGQEMQGL